MYVLKLLATRVRELEPSPNSSLWRFFD